MIGKRTKRRNAAVIPITANVTCNDCAIKPRMSASTCVYVRMSVLGRLSEKRGRRCVKERTEPPISKFRTSEFVSC